MSMIGSHQRQERAQSNKLFSVNHEATAITGSRSSINSNNKQFSPKLLFVSANTTTKATAAAASDSIGGSPYQANVMSVKRWLVYVICMTLLIFSAVVLFTWLLNRDTTATTTTTRNTATATATTTIGLHHTNESIRAGKREMEEPDVAYLSNWGTSASSMGREMEPLISSEEVICRLDKRPASERRHNLVDFTSDDNRVKVVLQGDILIYSGGNHYNKAQLMGAIPLDRIVSIDTRQLDSPLMPSIHIAFPCAHIYMHFSRAISGAGELHHYVHPLGAEVIYYSSDDHDHHGGRHVVKWSDVAQLGRMNFKFQHLSHYYCDQKTWTSQISARKRQQSREWAQLQLHYLEFEIRRSPQTPADRFETQRGGVC